MGTADEPPTGEERAYTLAATALDAFYAPDELSHDLARRRYAGLLADACEQCAIEVMHTLVGLLNQAALMLASERWTDLQLGRVEQVQLEWGPAHKAALKKISDAYVERAA